ncbi:YdcF family protein [Cohnella caldifontis]|uniref:YdcF family protein n=1 Tax=Cohnella caldifontis TaxID=3027471 RepID=UPI0023EA7E6C|nr:YdcF family protein [Cohnella sp. YIM B05605]
MSLPVSNLAGLERNRGKRSRKARYFLRAAAALAAALLVWLGWLYVRIATFDGIPEPDVTAKADAGIVLGASLWNDKPSPGLRERLDQALKLYREGAFSSIIVSGGLDAGGATITEAEGMRNYLLEQGVPDGAIRMDKDSFSTYENLKFSKRIMEEEGWRTAVIVTHRYHGARAADIARTLGYDPVQVSVIDSKVMNMAYHKTREVLAFTKWELTKLRLAFG